MVKLGRTTRGTEVRVAELTRPPGYRDFAPWHVAHVQPTADAVLVERWSHRVLRRQGRRVRLRLGCLELYRVGEAEACTVMRRITAEVEASRIWQRRLAGLGDQALASVLLAAVLLGVMLWLARQGSRLARCRPPAAAGRSCRHNAILEGRMTPSALVVTCVAGLLSGALGAAILLAIGRSGFRHRNPYGQLVFRSYSRWLVFRGTTAILRPLGVLLLFNGTVLLLAALNAPPDAWHAGSPAASLGWKAAVHE